MGKTLEKKFETLIQHFIARQYDGKLQNQPAKDQPTPETCIRLAEELKTANVALHRQREELLFAYQTLEIGYQRYWEFFNFAPEGYLVTDNEGIIREANQTILSMLSTKQSDLLGKPVTSLAPDIKHYDFGMQLNWFAGSKQMELRLQPLDRPPFYASLSISPQCNIQNKHIGLLWLVRDITGRKKMEDDLLKSRTELSLILEQTPCILWTTDTELRLISVSGTGSSSFHPPDTDIAGISVADYFNSSLDSVLARAHQRALAGNPQTFEFEWQGRAFQSTVEALKDTSEQTTGIIGAAFDITERKQAERILQRSERFSASLLQNSPYPIIVIAADTSISYVNPAFEKLTGFSSESVIGQKAPYPWWGVEDEEKALKDFRKILGKKKYKREKHYRKKNGEKFWVETTMLFIENENEPGCYLNTWVDITEARQLRENLEYYVMQITRVQEEERQRIARELHEETVQSLAALCLATEVIIKSREKGSDKTLHNLKELQEKINKVIEEVRCFSYDLRPGVLDYLGLTAALETLADELNDKGIQAHLQVTGKEKPLAPDMEITLFRITQEALNNIKKYSSASKVSLSIKYTRSKITLSIVDNGQGFNLPVRLTELANQGKLGLIGMEERARLYGGIFSIQSQAKRGTKITVSLPVHTR